MTVLHILLFGLVTVAGTAVVLTREPRDQAIVSGFFGLSLMLLFFSLHSPDVAIAALVVSTVGLPLMILLALGKVRGGS